MDSGKAVYQGLKNTGINFVVSLPCVNLGKIIEMVKCDPDIIHIPVTREKEGFGICAGAHGWKEDCAFNTEFRTGNSVKMF